MHEKRARRASAPGPVAGPKLPPEKGKKSLKGRTAEEGSPFRTTLTQRKRQSKKADVHFLSISFLVEVGSARARKKRSFSRKKFQGISTRRPGTAKACGTQENLLCERVRRAKGSSETNPSLRSSIKEKDRLSYSKGTREKGKLLPSTPGKEVAGGTPPAAHEKDRNLPLPAPKEAIRPYRPLNQVTTGTGKGTRAKAPFGSCGLLTVSQKGRHRPNAKASRERPLPARFKNRNLGDFSAGLSEKN